MIKERTLRLLYITAGCCCLVLAILGFMLPLLPGTPFLVLASLFFSRGSERLHSWLLNHRYLGPPIVDWEEHGRIRLEVKIFATVCIVVGLSISAYVSRLELPTVLILLAIVTCVLGYIWTRPSK